MLETLVFQKTDLGRGELSSRRLGLSNTLRLVLVLVDGRRDVRTLTAFSDTVAKDPECLLELLNLNLIEVVGETNELDERQPGFLRALREVNDVHVEPFGEGLVQVAPMAEYNEQQQKSRRSGDTAEMSRRSGDTENKLAGAIAPDRPSGQSITNLVRAKQTLVAALRNVLKDEAETACLRVQQAESIEDVLVLLPRLTDLVGLYTTASKGAVLHDQIRDLLLQ
jgi:hypothetical protein